MLVVIAVLLTGANRVTVFTRSSMEYTTLSDAKKLGLAAYQQWKEQANDAAPAAMNQPAAQPAVAAAAAGPARRKRVKRHKASPGTQLAVLPAHAHTMQDIVNTAAA